MSPSPQDPVPREAEPSRSQLVTPDDFGGLYQSWLTGIRQTTDTLEDWALVGIKRRGAVLARRLLEDLGGSVWLYDGLWGPMGALWASMGGP